MAANLKIVTTLADLETDRGKVQELPVEAIPELLERLEGLRARLWLRLNLWRDGGGEPQNPDRLLDVEEAASRLRMSPASLYRRHKSDPAYRALVVNTGTRKVLFSKRKIEAFLQRRTGR